MSIILSIDLGTSSMKTTLFTADGKIISQADAGYTTMYPAENRAEQRPNDWWSTLLTCLAKLPERERKKVVTLGLSGHMMAGFGINTSKGAEGAWAVGAALIHADTRASKETEEFVNTIGAQRIYSITGHRPSPAYSGPKLAWLRKHEPEQYRKSDYFLNPKDYLNFCLTGEIATDYSDASGTLMFDLTKQRWNGELGEALGIDPEKLPPVLPSSEIIGKVSRWAAGLTGLPESAVVVAGAGDGICAGVGAASVEPGAAYNYIGTTSWIATTSRAPVADPHMRVVTFAHAVPGLYHPLGVMQTAGAAVEWFCRKFLPHVDGDPSEEFDRLASASAAGSRGLMFLPYLLGERSPWWNTECRAAWLGLSQEHGLADMARALLEGVNHNLALIAEIVREYAPFQELSLLGGGGLSAHWPQMLCNSYAVPLFIHKDTVSITARGAAVIAGVGAGLYRDFTVAKNFVAVLRRLTPEPEEQKRMRARREEFAAAYKKLYS
ncbi:MAG: xylulokinase [Salinispira sp.]